MLRTLILLCFIIFLHKSEGIVNLDPEKKQHIDDFVNSLLFDCDKHEIAGMNLAVVYQGETVYTTGYGVRNLESQEPVTENTVYAIASVSKHFTTTLLGQKLKDAGYTWDAKVRGILADLGTDFYFADPLRANMTTLRDLAAHSNGIFRNDAVWFQNMTRAEQASRLRFLNPDFELRTEFIYNNLFYTLLGHVTEELVGTPWELLVKNDIFDKLGMVNSSFMYVTREEDVELATPYQLDDNGDLRETAWITNANTGADWGPAAGIVSTANDMAQWMKMLLADGQNEAGEEVFSSDVIAETRLPVNSGSATSPQDDPFLPPNTPVRYENFMSYGLGLGQGSYRGYRSATHSGGAFGHLTEFQLYPDLNLGVYMSVNGAPGYYDCKALIIMYIADILLGEEPWLNATSACAFPPPAVRSTPFKPAHPNPDIAFYKTPSKERTRETLPKHMVNAFLGNYGNFAHGNMTVVADDVTGNAILEFDFYHCVTRFIVGRNDSFYCEGFGDYWWVDLFYVRFDTENEPAQYVDIIFFALWEGRIRFTRDLRQDEAPGPRDYWPTCEELSPEKNIKMKIGHDLTSID